MIHLLAGGDPPGNWGGKGPIWHLCEFSIILIPLGIAFAIRKVRRDYLRRNG